MKNLKTEGRKGRKQFNKRRRRERYNKQLPWKIFISNRSLAAHERLKAWRNNSSQTIREAREDFRPLCLRNMQNIAFSLITLTIRLKAKVKIVASKDE